MKPARSTQSSARQAYAYIKERVIGGEYTAGARLTEEQLAQDLGTSRTPVREAMRMLVAEGFLYFKPNHGTFVQSWTVDELRDIFDMRVLLESEVAAHAARNMNDPAVARLRLIQHELESCVEREMNESTFDQMAVLNRDFHNVIIEVSANARLESMLANVVELPIALRTYHRYNRAQLERSLRHHHELIDAFSARDADWARDVMSCHIRSARFALLGSGEQK